MKRILIAALAILCLCGCNSTSSSDTNSTAEETGGTGSSVEVTFGETAGETASETAGETAATSEASAESAAEGDSTNTSDSELNGVFAKIKDSVELPDMVELNDNLLMRYYGLSADAVSDYAGGVDSSGVGQDEIVLMKAADESQVDTVVQALQTRYDSKLSQQENYNPDEAEKIRNCSVETNGLYVTLIISNDASTITDIVNGSIG